MRALLFLIIAILTTLAQVNCKQPTNFSYSIPIIDSTTLTKNVSINQLAKNYSRLHARYIKTEGTFYLGFEQIGVFSDGMVFSNNRTGFWLEMNSELIPENDWPLILKASGQRVILKGQLDTSKHGHLGQYSATIKNIYYFKVK